MAGGSARSVQVPSQAEFDALAQQVDEQAAQIAALETRVSALEEGGGGGGNTESPDGTTIEDATGQIVMGDGTVVTLTAARGRLVFNSQTDQTTNNVILGLKWDGLLYQENAANSWYQGTYHSWQQVPGDPRQPPRPSTGKFTIANGRIITPNGQPWAGRGINCDIHQLQSQLVTNLDTGAPCTETYPGLSYVRVNVYVKDMPSLPPTFAEAQIKALTKRGIVVVLDPHDYYHYYTGTAPTKGCYSGDDLNKVCAFMEAWATHFRDDPFVWYGTENEPSCDFGGKLVEDMITAIYNAVRRGSPDAIVQLNPVSSYTIEPWTGFNAGIWRNWTQCAIELHYYNWASKFAYDGAPGYSTDLNTNKQAIATLAANLQAAHTGDGVPPIVLGEYGDSTTGDAIDPGGMVAVQAVHESGYGTAAWHWFIGGPHEGDLLLNPPPSTHTHPYGTTVRDHIQGAAHGVIATGRLRHWEHGAFVGELELLGREHPIEARPVDRPAGMEFVLTLFRARGHRSP